MLIYNNTEQRLFENNRTGRKWNTPNYIAGARVCARKRVDKKVPNSTRQT